MKKLLSVLFLSVLLLIGCGDDSEKEPSGPLKLVPQNANLIAYIDVPTIMDEIDIEGLIDRIPKEPGDPQSLQDVFDLLGINELGEAVLFGDMSNLSETEDILGGDDDYMGLIIMGSFNEERLIQTITSESEEELEVSTYKGVTTHSSAEEDMAITILGPDLMMLSTIGPVKDVIDVKEGSTSPLKGEVLDTFQDLGTGMVKLAMVMPDDLADQMQEGMDDDDMMGFNPLGFIEDMTTLGLVVDKKGDSMPIDVRICFTNEESAENMKGMLGFVMAMFDMEGMEIPEDERAIMDILKAMEMDLDGSCVEINLTITSDILEQMAESFEMGFMEGLGEGLGGGLGEGFGFGRVQEDDEDLAITELYSVELAVAALMADPDEPIRSLAAVGEEQNDSRITGGCYCYADEEEDRYSWGDPPSIPHCLTWNMVDEDPNPLVDINELDPDGEEQGTVEQVSAYLGNDTTMFWYCVQRDGTVHGYIDNCSSSTGSGDCAGLVIEDL